MLAEGLSEPQIQFLHTCLLLTEEPLCRMSSQVFEAVRLCRNRT